MRNYQDSRGGETNIRNYQDSMQRWRGKHTKMAGQQHLQRKRRGYVFIIRIMWRDKVGLSQKRGSQYG
jgi:hypothetical protein